MNKKTVLLISIALITCLLSSCNPGSAGKIPQERTSGKMSTS